MARIATTLLLCLIATLAQAAEFKAAYVTASEAILSNPHDIDLSVDGRHLYVSDVGNDRIAVLDAQTLKLTGTIGGNDGLAAPHDVHRGADGRLYVADTGNDRIVVFQLNGAEGKRVAEITGPFGSPEGVFAGPDGLVYVTGAGTGNIAAMKDGKPVAQAGGLRAPHDVIALKDGNLWVADAGNNRMVQMSADLKQLKTLEGPPFNFQGCRYQDMNDEGILIVADKYTHSIKAIGPDGDLLAVIGTGKRGKGPNLFTTPEGVVVRGKDVWFSDSGNNRIVRYRITSR